MRLPAKNWQSVRTALGSVSDTVVNDDRFKFYLGEDELFLGILIDNIHFLSCSLHMKRVYFEYNVNMDVVQGLTHI